MNDCLFPKEIIGQNCSGIAHPNEELLTQSRSGNSSGVKFILRHCNGIDINTKRLDVDSIPLIYASEYGHSDILQLLLEEEGIDINKADYKGRTALHHACHQGYTEAVELLVQEMSIDMNKADKEGQTPLHSAFCTSFCAPLRHDPSYEGHSEVIQLLLQKKSIDINKADNGGRTALYFAAQKGNSGVAKTLLQRPEIDINKSPGRWPPLWEASSNNHTEIVQLLLEHPKTNITKGIPAFECNIKVAKLIFNKDVTEMEQGQKLLVATLLGDERQVTTLLEVNNTLINSNDSLQRTLLFWASTRNNINISTLLLRNPQILVNRRSIHGATALYQASRYGLLEMVTLLLEHPRIAVNLATLDRKTPLIEASFHGHYKVVERLLSVVNIDVNYGTFDGKTALSYAVLKDKPDVLELLLRCPKTDTHLVDEEYMTAFDRAKDRNQTQSIKLFTSRGKQQIKKGHTCCSKFINRGIHIAVKKQDLKWIKTFLVCPGIEINVHNNDGYTPLNMAVDKGLTEMVKIFLGHQRIDVNKLNTGQKQNVVLIASERRDTEILRLLLEHPQTFVNQKDVNGYTAMSMAVKNLKKPGRGKVDRKYLEVVYLLLKCPKTDVSISFDELQQAVGLQKASKMRKTALEAEPSCCLNVKESLLSAAWVGDFRAIRGLLQCPGSKSNINTVDGKGRTQLYIASMMDHLQAVKVLSNNKHADVNLGARFDGGTPFSIASEKSHFNVLRSLIVNGQPDEDKGWCTDNWAQHLQPCNWN